MRRSALQPEVNYGHVETFKVIHTCGLINYGQILFTPSCTGQHHSPARESAGVVHFGSSKELKVRFSGDGKISIKSTTNEVIYLHASVRAPDESLSRTLGHFHSPICYPHTPL